jgi:DNA damage-inducible protein 1
MANDIERMRLSMLGNPALMSQLSRTRPELAGAIRSDPSQFATLIQREFADRDRLESEKNHQVDLLNADPYDVEAQKKIEEAIRQQAVLENMEHAMEYSPESFGNVTMLYIDVEVNGTKVKAFVDSGAQSTIISPDCAEKCGIMRLVDQRFSGIARGVGTAKILGRIHSAQIKLDDLFLPVGFTVLEGRDVDLLFGLDMLKRHQACIDLEKNCLRIQGREIRFLAEHELPSKAREAEELAQELEAASARPGAKGIAPTAPHPIAASASSGAAFPGAGQSLGAPPASTSTPAATNEVSPFPEADIQAVSVRLALSSFSANLDDLSQIVNLGVSREQAIQTLTAAGGNGMFALLLPKTFETD